ncbi:MAG: signal peptidase I [Rickettsiales bacterium]
MTSDNAAVSDASPSPAPSLRKEAGSFLFSVVIALVVALTFRSLFFEPFYIPSGSMKPTLLEGDYVFVSKYTYGYSRYSFPLGFPLFKGRVLGREPKRGEVVVFKHPKNPGVNYIKRLIGLPGDVIRVTGGRLFINGEAVRRDSIAPFGDTEKTEDGSKTRVSVPAYQETLPGGANFTTIDALKRGPLDNTGDYTVPPGHYFVMGDNRDNSVDSRVPEGVGFVPEENLLGPARVVLFSSDASFIKLYSWIANFRTDRILRSLYAFPTE